MVVEETKNKIWFEKYRPKTIDELILPKRIKDELRGYVKRNDIPNLLLYSPGGMGKTSTARVLINALGMDSIEINGSIDTSVDVVRDRIIRFASTGSLMQSNSHKCLFITEADGFSENAKNAMKNIIEKFENNIRFIFDTNHVEQMNQPIRSRCTEIDFNFSKNEYAEMMKDVMKYCERILECEKVEYTKKDIADLIKQRFPDMRKIIVDLQKCSVSGVFTPINNSPEEQFTEIITALKERNYDNIRNIVKNIPDPDAVILRMYQRIDSYCDRKSIPVLIMIIGQYQHTSKLCVSQEINLLAMFTEIFSKNLTFKEDK